MLISIIIPIYKVEPYLRKCVDSVLAQTFTDFEAILIDDGSPDGCGEICDEYAARDPRVRVVHQVNSGLSAARNAGLSIANGEWITFLDSDDWINETYLADLLAGVKRGYKASIAIMRQTDGINDLSLVGSELPNVVTPEEVYDKCDLLAVWACGKLFHRDLIGDLRFPVGKIQEDEFFTYQVLFKAPKVAIAHKAVYNYLHRSDSIVGGRWYPERMLAVDGMKKQIAYFDEHGYPIAARHVRRRLIIWLCAAMHFVRKDAQIRGDVAERVRREFSVVCSDNQDLIRRDCQLLYLTRYAKQPQMRRFLQVQYLFGLMRDQGIAVVAERLARRLWSVLPRRGGGGGNTPCAGRSEPS